MNQRVLFITLAIFIFTGLFSQNKTPLKTGADWLVEHENELSNKKIGMIVNQTSIISQNKSHLVDNLFKKKVNIVKIFAPEHGFRGMADAGEKIDNSTDNKTGISILSLYGKNKKPSAEQLQGIDLMIFDIQDVGVRFYTYISTLFYAMEACSDHNIPIWVLDRPNPNDYIDGPILQDTLRSFVGIAPIPILHGLTVGEFAQMVNGEKWLHSKSKKCELRVIKMEGWKHKQPYSLPIKPSPNLPNDLSIKLYPSLCLFEASPVSIGRGTTFPFQVIGYPDSTLSKFYFTPLSLPGFDKFPLHKNKKCYGIDLRNTSFEGGFTLRFFIEYYNKLGLGKKMFTSARSFDQLTGDQMVRKLIMEGKEERYIKNLWQNDLCKYKEMRQKYLLYKE